jgi:aryl-alcohol dehydrogenase-like predicted oxidoreductase
MQVVKDNHLSTLPFYGLAKGFLTGKYRAGITVDSVRASSVAEYFTPTGWQVLDALTQISAARGKPIAAIALAWLRSNPTVITPIASATSLEQLRQIMQVVELSQDEVELLNSASN